MKSTRNRTSRSCIGRAAVCVAGVLLAGGAITFSAFAQDGPGATDRLANDQVPGAGRDVPLSMPNPITNEREIVVPGSSMVLNLWDEERPDGSLAPFFAIRDHGADDTAGQSIGDAREADYVIPLRYANFDPLAAVPAIPQAELQADAGNEIYVVQFWTVPLDEFRAQIEDLGGTIYRFLPDQAHIVRMPAATAAQVGQLPYVRWVGAFHPAYKLDELIPARLAAGPSPEGVVNRYIIEVFERDATPMPVEAAVAADDSGAAPVQARGVQGTGQLMAVQALINLMGGGAVVHNVRPSQFWIEASVTDAQMLLLARMNEVHWIEPWRGPMEMDMNNVRTLGGANALETATGMSGEGIRGEVFDTELRTTHTEFTTITPVVLSPGNTSASLHGTSVFSNVFARGATASARGLLPDAAEGYFYRSSDSTYFGGADQSRLQIAQTASNGTNRCVFQTSSVGQPRTTAYTAHSAEMDDVIFQTLLVHCQSQSNAGCCTPPQNSRPGSWSKNAISGGAVNHYNNTNRSDDTWKNGANCSGPSCGGSIGPAADGRIKPDLSFFFDSINSARGSSNTAYTQFGGTSSGTPCVAGHVGLFHQMWQENTWEGSGLLAGGGAADAYTNRPRPTIPKAALINKAFRYDWTGAHDPSITRFVQGWGTPDVDALYDIRDKTFYVNESYLLTQGQTKSHGIMVGPGEPDLSVTMVYMDPMGTTSSTTHRINNLNLKVTSPTGTIYRGNNGLTAGNASTSGGGSNSKDTVENVFIPSPEAGRWCVEVTASTVSQDSHTETTAIDADYALWVTGGRETGSLKTTFRGGNGHDGNMFDITAQDVITITGFDVSHDGGGATTFEVYYTAGGFAGHETTPGDWTLLGTDTITPIGSTSGAGVASHIDIGGLTIHPGETYGIYVTDNVNLSGGLDYTNGTETWTNDEITISTGKGIAYPFAGTFNSRSWNGTVHYTVQDSGPGPFAYSIQSNGDDRLYQINLLTGQAKSMGDPMTFGDAEGLTFGPRGLLYAIGGSFDELWNVTSPTGSMIGATGPRTGGEAGLEFYDGVLYNMNGGGGGSTLYRINTSNGAATAIGSTTIFIDGLAIRSDGTAYGTDWLFTDSLYEVNLATGATTLVGSLGLGNVIAESGLAFIGHTLYAITWDGEIYTLNTATGAATLVATVTIDGCTLAGGWEGLAIAPCSAVDLMPLEAFGSTFSSATLTRGYWFTAPTDFLISGLRVPDEFGEGVQNVEVVRFDGAIPPPIFGATTNNFVSLFRHVGVAGNHIISTAIPVGAGDVIGILGAAGTTTMRNSYATANTFNTEIHGLPVTLKRLGMQFNLNSTPARNLWTENPSPVSRVEMYTIRPPDITLDADTLATGSTINSVPLATPFGTVSGVGTVDINSFSDPEMVLAGSAGSVFDIDATRTAEVFFDFDVDSATFVYGGNTGLIRIEARDMGGAVVDSFFQADTGTGEPAGPQTLSGTGIRSLYWEDPTGSFAALDNICIGAGPPPNDECADAIPVAVGVPVQFNNTNATPTTNEGFTCGTAAPTVRTMWYSVTGTGNTMMASTCTGVAGFTEIDTVLRVFCGGCPVLTCVGGNDDGPIPGCNLPVNAFRGSEFRWCSQAGAEYLIVVGAFGSATRPTQGDIQLTVTDNGASCSPTVLCIPVTVCGTCLGDVNGDLLRDGLDISYFVSCVITGVAPGGDCLCADFVAPNGPGLEDIGPFVAALLLGTPCP